MRASGPVATLVRSVNPPIASIVRYHIMNSLVRVGLLQTKCIGNKEANLKYIEAAVREAAHNQAKMCLLGEIVNSPYDKKYMGEFAENLNDSPTLRLLQSLSKELGLYTVCSLPERAESGKLYNTGLVVRPLGYHRPHRKENLWRG
ncbi:unnamed protein product [Sphagnum jensenii]